MKIKFLDPPDDHALAEFNIYEVVEDKSCAIIYTHFSTFDPIDYPSLRYVLCPCTGLGHLKYLDIFPGLKVIYLDDKKYLGTHVWATAEHTVSLMLQCCKLANQELCESSIGFIGNGRVAKQVQQLLKGFEVDIMVFDKVNKGYNCSLEAIATNADIISVHLAENLETKGMLGLEFFGLMKRGSIPIFINTSRSSIVDGGALCNNLINDKFAAVGLDVTETYTKEVMDCLKSDKRVILTDHIAGKSDVSRYNTDRYVFNKLREEVKNG